MYSRDVHVKGLGFDAATTCTVFLPAKDFSNYLNLVLCPGPSMHRGGCGHETNLNPMYTIVHKTGNIYASIWAKATIILLLLILLPHNRVTR